MRTGGFGRQQPVDLRQIEMERGRRQPAAQPAAKKEGKQDPLKGWNGR